MFSNIHQPVEPHLERTSIPPEEHVLWAEVDMWCDGGDNDDVDDGHDIGNDGDDDDHHVVVVVMMWWWCVWLMMSRFNVNNTSKWMQEPHEEPFRDMDQGRCSV